MKMMIMIMVHIGCLPFLLQWLIIQLAEAEEGEEGKRNEAAKMFSRYDFYQYRNHGN